MDEIFTIDPLPDERLKEAANQAIEEFGVGAGAVRTINGTHHR